MLIKQYGIAIRICYYDTCGAGAVFIGLLQYCYIVCFEVCLNSTNIIKRWKCVGIIIPAGVERDDIVGKHALKQTNQGISIFHNEIIAGHTACKNSET